MKQVDEMNVSARVDSAKKSVFGFLSAGAFHSCGQFIRIDRIVQITCFFLTLIYLILNISSWLLCSDAWRKPVPTSGSD